MSQREIRLISSRRAKRAGTAGPDRGILGADWMSPLDSSYAGPNSGVATNETPRAIGRYLLFREIAAGGMASVHLGRLVGAAGFARTVAIKRLLPHFGKEPEFIAMFMDEARIAARIRHPNVVSTLDVVTEGDELFLVMDYVEGEALSKLLRASAQLGKPAPRAIVLAVMYGALQGLHAAHEAKSEAGEPLDVVHRDVSPQNILVGVDGRRACSTSASPRRSAA